MIKRGLVIGMQRLLEARRLYLQAILRSQNPNGHELRE